MNITDGYTSFPVATNQPSLFALDRTVYDLLAFIRRVLDRNLQSYFAQICQAKSLVFDHNPTFAFPSDHSSVDPSPSLLTDKHSFPLVAVYRVSGVDTNLGTSRAAIAGSRSLIMVDLVLPPEVMRSEDSRAAMLPFLNAARQVIATNLRDSSWDPTDKVLALEVGSYKYDYLVDNSGRVDPQSFFPALSMELHVTESMRFDTSDLVPFTSAHIHIDKQTEELDTFQDVAQQITP